MPSTKFIRAAQRPAFAAVSSQTVRDRRLSPLALAIITYRADQADAWELRDDDLRDRFGVGRDQLLKAWAELCKAGYVTETRFRMQDGSFRFERILREESVTAAPHRLGRKVAVEEESAGNVVPLRAARERGK